MFGLLEMKDSVNQRTFFGNEAWVSFKMMERDEEKTLRFLGGLEALIKVSVPLSELIASMGWGLKDTK